jgi:hypothetical protein
MPQEQRGFDLAYDVVSSDLELGSRGELVAERDGNRVTVYREVGDDGPVDGSAKSIYLDRLYVVSVDDVIHQAETGQTPIPVSD